VRLNEIYDQYKDKLQFFCVYIQEAHPTDGWQVLSNLEQDVIFESPINADERAEMASTCALRLNFRMPMLLDNMTNEVDLKYAALPERLYVLDKDGKVFFQGIMGSGGFDVDTWLEAVEAQAALSG
jgi:type I thyroxine 5'-deiodinase